TGPSAPCGPAGPAGPCGPGGPTMSHCTACSFGWQAAPAATIRTSPLLFLTQALMVLVAARPIVAVRLRADTIRARMSVRLDNEFLRMSNDKGNLSSLAGYAGS